MILCVAGRSRTVVCADSRGIRKSGGISDDCQKLLKAGDRTACGFVGFSAFGPAPADQVSNRICGLLASAGRLKDSPREFLAAIGDMIYVPLKRLALKEGVAKFRWDMDTEVAFVAFCLSHGAKGELTLLELRLPIRIGAPNTPAENSTELTLGEPEITTHLADHIPSGPLAYWLGNEGKGGGGLPIDPDLSDSAVLEQVDRLFRECANQIIGGPIDVAAIDGQGFSWLRKKSCHAGT